MFLVPAMLHNALDIAHGLFRHDWSSKNYSVFWMHRKTHPLFQEYALKRHRNGEALCKLLWLDYSHTDVISALCSMKGFNDCSITALQFILNLDRTHQFLLEIYKVSGQDYAEWDAPPKSTYTKGLWENICLGIVKEWYLKTTKGSLLSTLPISYFTMYHVRYLSTSLL